MKKFLNKIYFVQEGDTIEKIAKLYNINPMKIIIQNNISPLSLKEGDKIYFD